MRLCSYNVDMPDWQTIVVGVLIALALAITLRSAIKGVRSGCADGGCGCSAAKPGSTAQAGPERLGVRKELIALGTPKRAAPDQAARSE